jgi:hypothetical protein
MKCKSFVFPTIVFLWLIFIFSSPVQQKAKWKGTIEEADGITVVKNPKEPMYGDDIFLLEEDLSIGEEGKGDEYIFSNISDIAVDKTGKIYILDIGEAHIRVFDKNGKYTKTIGNKGQGPGEMSSPTSLQITPHDEIVVNDWIARKIHFFQIDGNFLRSVSQRDMGFFTDPKINKKEYITASYLIMDNEVTYVLKQFNPELKDFITIFSKVILKYPNFNPFFPQCYWDIIDEDNLVWGFADKYELNIIDAAGKTVRKITKEYDPVKITDEEKEKITEGLQGGVNLIWKDHHNPFIYLCVDDVGRIYTQTYEKAPKSGYYYHDVFDHEGKYMAKIPLKSRPYVINKGKLYTIEEDEEGYQLVKRYRVTWKT